MTPLSDGFVQPNARGTVVQRKLYEKFLFKCKDEGLADWCGFFDVDEFLMFEEGYDLNRLEEEYKDCGGVLLSWRIYGASGHINRPDGGVVESYTVPMPDGTQLDQDWQWDVKSLVNVNVCNSMKHIHIFNGCKLTDMTDGGHLCFEKAWINHYYTKSWEDYLDRIFSRGNMQNNFRCLDKFFKCNPDLMDKKEKMVMEQRYRHTESTMWISRDMKIISGGNINKLRELNKSKETPQKPIKEQGSSPYEYADKKYRERYLKSPKVILGAVSKFYKINSAVDVGCGLCDWTEILKSLGAKVTAIDGEWYDKESVMIADKFICHDLNNGVLHLEKVDLAVCLEVIEHVGKAHGKELVETLTEASDVVLFSAAIPKQGGQGHVNEQWLTYWKTMFNEKEYVLADIIRPIIWTNRDVEVWYRQNTVMFIHKNRYDDIMKSYKECGFENTMIDVVHPEYYIRS